MSNSLGTNCEWVEGSLNIDELRGLEVRRLKTPYFEINFTSVLHFAVFAVMHV